MQKPLLHIAFLSIAILLAGCASTPEPEIVAVPQTPLSEFTDLSNRILESGGLAAVGVGKSKSSYLARNWATVNGRLNLQNVVDTKMDTLRRGFAEESGTPQNAQSLDAFDTAAQTIKDQIQNSDPKELKQETTNDTFTVYALMKISPQQILDQLRKEPDLYTRFAATQTGQTFNTAIQNYETYKNATTNAPVVQ